MHPYHIAHNNAVLIDLSWRGRLRLTGRDQVNLIHRMSTNDLHALQDQAGMATVLTTPIGRIIDLLMFVKLGETAWIITGEGRGEQIYSYLRRNIFFNDQVQVEDIGLETRLYGLYGINAKQLLGDVIPEARTLAPYAVAQHQDLYVMRMSPLAGMGYWLFGESSKVQKLCQVLRHNGVTDADTTTYNLLRIEAGEPLADHELTEDYIPLEAGLWHAVSFNKGCYTGQEVIARMESRGKLAKILVRLSSDSDMERGTALLLNNAKVGTLTSLAQQPDGQYLGLGFVKPNAISDNTVLATDNGQSLKILGIAGTQPKR